MNKLSRFAACSVAASAAAVMSGCAGGISGVGGGSSYACEAPPGVSCMSVTGINANAAKNNLPALRARSGEEARENSIASGGAFSQDKTKASGDIDPIFGDSVEQAAQAPTYYGTPAERGARVSPAAMEAPYSGVPLRTAPRVLRIWMAPFEDAEADLHDQKLVYVTVHTGRWVLEANQVNIQQQFKQVFPLSAPEKKKEEKSAAPQVNMNGEITTSGE